jgi:peptidoglycan L-alanyl-D-glutamate endopeptidase CwlK
MTFVLGRRSEENLVGVDPRLIRCVRRAITTSSVDFTVFEGVRSLERQRELVAKGVSRTLNSRHLEGEAVDNVPWIAGRAQWQAPACVVVASAMRDAAVVCDVDMTWGAVWDRPLRELDPGDLEGEIEAYVARYRAARGPKARPLIDYPHFELRP